MSRPSANPIPPAAGLPTRVRVAEVAGERTARATCPYCGVGCVLRVRAEGEAMQGIHADPADAPNFGMLCPKGAFLFKSDAPESRLTTPLIREGKGGPLRPASWAEATRLVADRIQQSIAEQGPQSVAWYGSGQLDTEASYVFTKLFKGFIGSNETDTNSRLCMSSAVAGYVHSFGSDGPPTCYDDFEHAETFFILGANMASNHPVLFNRVRRRRATEAGSRIIVIDPRRSKTAEFADLHLQVRPGGDVALLRLIAKRLLAQGDLDADFVEQHTEGWAALRGQLDSIDEAAMLEACGVSAEQIDLAARWMGGGRRLLSLYCMGANQSSRGTDKNTALIDLHLLTGTVGREGCGPFSLTGQPNAMGGREVGYLSHQLPGYRKVSDAEDRGAVERAWGVPPGAISPLPGRSAVEMFDAAARGELGVLWVACTNPAVSMPDLDVVHDGLRQTPLVVAQDCFSHSETLAFADVILPAATWGEKSGTMTNSERLVTRSEAVREAPGLARPDWWIAAAVAQAMGHPGFDYADAAAIWDEFRQLTAGTLCDMSGITNKRLAGGGVHWPCPSEDQPGEARRYTDQRFPTPTGRARFSTATAIGPAEPVDDRFPLAVTTGRVASQWHTRARTGNVPELVRQAPEPFAEVHPDDAEKAGVGDGDFAHLISRRLKSKVRIRVTDSVPPGVVFTAFHWGDSFAPDTAANRLTHRACDAVSKQPELKHLAARLEPAPPGWDRPRLADPV